MQESAAQTRNQKRGLWLLAGLGVLLALSGALVWHSQTVAKAQFALDEAQPLLDTGKKQDARQALSLLDEAALLAPKMAEVYTKRADAYQTLGEYEKVAADASKAIALEPENVSAHKSYAHALIRLKKYRQALKMTERAIALEPDNFGAQYLHGLAYWHLKMYPQALRAFDKCIELYPKVAKPYLARARILRAQGHYKRAFQACSAAIRYYGKGDFLVSAYITRGNASASQKQFRKAIADYDVAITIDPQYAMGFYNRGRSYLKLKKFALAMNDFDRAIALDKDYIYSYFFRAQVFMYREEWKKALDDCNRALQLDSNYDRARQLRIWANYILDDAGAMERDCNFLIRQKRDVAWAYSQRGLARLLRFRDEDARRDFEKSRAHAKIEVPEKPDVFWKELMAEAARAKVHREKIKTKP